MLAIATEDSIYTLMSDYIIPSTPGESLPDLVRMVTGEDQGIDVQEL